MGKPRRERTHGVDCCAGMVVRGQLCHFSSMIAAVHDIAVLLKAEIYWPRPERLIIGPRTVNNPGRALFIVRIQRASLSGRSQGFALKFPHGIGKDA